MFAARQIDLAKPKAQDIVNAMYRLERSEHQLSDEALKEVCDKVEEDCNYILFFVRGLKESRNRKANKPTN